MGGALFESNNNRKITNVGNYRMRFETNKEFLENLVSADNDFYMLYVVPEEDIELTDEQKFQDYYNKDFNQLLSKESLDTLYFGSYLWLMPIDNLYPRNKLNEYFESIKINEYPAFLIFDSEQLVFSSSNIDEVEQFLSTREETPGIKLRKAEEIDYHNQYY